ncbi:hypothetical protein DKP79_29120, partial [Klebsiella pneumoniae]
WHGGGGGQEKERESESEVRLGRYTAFGNNHGWIFNTVKSGNYFFEVFQYIFIFVGILSKYLQSTCAMH